MYLTLEVVSSQATTLGPARRQVVGPKGLTIGRAPGNDWVLPGDYISKQHARIRFEGGQFLVEGIGRNPIAIGRADNAIPNRQPCVLEAGDRLFLEQYEVLVRVVDREPGPTAAPPEAAGWSTVSTERLSTDRLPTEQLDSADLGTESLGTEKLAGSRSTGPLATAAARFAASSEAPTEREIHLPGLEDPAADPLAESPTTLEAVGEPAEEMIPEDWVSSSPPPSLAPDPRRTQPTSGPLQLLQRTASPATSPMRQTAPAAAVRARTPAAASDPGPRPAYRAPAELLPLLQAVGVSERDYSPELVRELGLVLRVAVEGIMEMLRSRADIKSELRLPLTRVQSRENNPLKFSPNVETVLNTLLVQRNPAYLSTVQAFQDAFADIRNHHLAMLEGLRAAFDSLFQSFEPGQLQQDFESSARRGRLLQARSSRYWDQYVERYADLGRDTEHTFRRLFGDAFAAAYERQLQRLKDEPGERG